MRFLETIEHAKAFLERNERVSLRVLKREFALEDEVLEELLEELVDVQQVAACEGKIPLWIPLSGWVRRSVGRRAPLEEEPGVARPTRS